MAGVKLRSRTSAPVTRPVFSASDQCGPLVRFIHDPGMQVRHALVGGKTRIIDFALSNALNSGIRRIGVATQYKAHSLIRHLTRGWTFMRPERNETFDILPASQRVSELLWYRGTADAVFQNIDIVQSY